MFSGEGDAELEGDGGDEGTHSLSSRHEGHASIEHRATVNWPRYSRSLCRHSRGGRGGRNKRRRGVYQRESKTQDRRFGAGQAEIELMLSATTEGTARLKT